MTLIARIFPKFCDGARIHMRIFGGGPGLKHRRCSARICTRVRAVSPPTSPPPSPPLPPVRAPPRAVSATCTARSRGERAALLRQPPFAPYAAAEPAASRLRCFGTPVARRRCGCSWLAAGALAGSPTESFRPGSRGFTPCADFPPPHGMHPVCICSRRRMSLATDIRAGALILVDQKFLWSRMGNAARADRQPTARVTARSWAWLRRCPICTRPPCVCCV